MKKVEFTEEQRDFIIEQREPSNDGTPDVVWRDLQKKFNDHFGTNYGLNTLRRYYKKLVKNGVVATYRWRATPD